LHACVDPIFWGKFKWTDRHNSLVTIENRLPLPEGLLPLRLKIQRSLLELIFQGGPLKNNESFDAAAKVVLEHAGFDANFLQETGVTRRVFFQLKGCPRT
jgi:hypothetical protein